MAEGLNGLKIGPYSMLPKSHFKFKDTHRLKVKGWKSYFLQMEPK